MEVKAFYHQDTSTCTYVVSDPDTKICAVIDSVRDFDLASGKVWNESADLVIDYIQSNGLTLEWILETHVHADHLTAAKYIQGKLGGHIAIGENIKNVLAYWIPVFNASDDTPADGSQFDKLFADDETFKIGNLNARVIHTPGHTPDSNTFLIEDALFVGDTIFMPEGGTARTDFPGGSSRDLYQSIHKLYALPDATRLFVCHDYPPEGKEPHWQTTVGDEKKRNVMIANSVSEDTFVELRDKRDYKKAVPRYLLPSIQVNLRAGDLGIPESNQTQYIKIPVNKMG